MSNPRETASFKKIVARKTLCALNRICTIYTVFNSTNSTDEAIKEIIFITIFTFPEKIILSF